MPSDCSTLQATKGDFAVENRRAKGIHGEILAAQALESGGYTIIARNWRCAEGEIDLIARQAGEWVFIEVRGSRAGIDAALESISQRKWSRLNAAIAAYLASHELDEAGYRVDLVAVDYRSGAVEIIRDASPW